MAGTTPTARLLERQLRGVAAVLQAPARGCKERED